jgi:acetoin utilization protein AcuB
MLVRDIMRTAVVVATPDTTVVEAVRLARERGIRHLPVLEGPRLVGIVSDRDLKRAIVPAEAVDGGRQGRLPAVRVREIMSREVLTVGAGVPVENAARVMVRERVGALPVTEEGRLVGIVTETDVLALFVRAMGVGEPSSRLDIWLGSRPTAMTEVVRAIEEAGTTVASIVTLVSPDGGREAVVRVATIDPRRAITGLRRAGYAVRDGEGRPAAQARR